MCIRDRIKAAIIIAVKKNYEVEEDHIRVEIDPDTGRFDVALIQDIVADEDLSLIHISVPTGAWRCQGRPGQ